jgi:hypothetical protein
MNGVCNYVQGNYWRALDGTVLHLESNNQMVSTRSGGGQDVWPVIRAHIANQQNQAPPPPVDQAMDPTMQQFFAAQMQLI